MGFLKFIQSDTITLSQFPARINQEAALRLFPDFD